MADRVGDGSAPDAREGDHAEQTWTAAPATSITRIRLWRSVGKQLDDNWNPYMQLVGSSVPFESCEIDGNVSCSRGGDGWTPGNTRPTDTLAYRDLTGLSTTGLIVGITCRSNETGICTNGGRINNANADLYGAFFTISDTSKPTVGTPSGSAWSATGWNQGKLSATLSSSDNAGISATRLYVDGRLEETTDGSCIWDRPIPCTDQATGASVNVDTTALSDGTHVLQLAAVDAAGNEQRASETKTLQVDNNPPAAPVGLTAPGGTTNYTGRFDLNWSLPPDDGAPLTEARYTVCRDGQCTAPQKTTTPTSLTGLQLPTEHTYTVSIWLVDALGHTDPTNAATIDLTRWLTRPGGGTTTITTRTPTSSTPASGPTSPAPTTTASTTPVPTTPTKAAANLTFSATRSGARVRVVGTLNRRASGRVRVRYAARVGRRSRSLTRAATIRNGRFTLTLTLPRSLRAARRGTLTVTYAGDADTKADRRHKTVTLRRLR